MIQKELNDGILTIRMAHRKASALDAEFSEALAAALAEATTGEAKAVILTGSGSIFSAGVDLPRLIAGGPEYVKRFLPHLSAVLWNLLTIPKPVIGAANGHAIAGGCLIMLACDYRLMAAGNGRIGVPELLVGVPFPPLALEIVRFAMPGHVRNRMIYLGETLSADVALQRGLIEEVVPAEGLETRAREVAGQLSAIPHDAFRLTKQQLRAPMLERANTYTTMYGQETAATWESPETHEHIRDYIERTFGKK